MHGRLVAERERLNLTQTDLRQLMEVSKGTQIRYESGETSPDAKYLARLLEAKFDVLYILTGQRSPGALTEEQQILLCAYEAAPGMLKNAALGVLRSHLKS
jgi:transcriptional regulator with XRE-family HTH domain